MIRRELEGVQSSNQVVGLKEKLKLKKSLQRNFSRISFFNGKKEARFNIKVSLQRKLTSMMSYIKLFWISLWYAAGGLQHRKLLIIRLTYNRT